MRPTRLTLQNYRSLLDLDLDLSGITTAAVIGPNGAGKTSICESIIWALWGEHFTSGVDAVISEGADGVSAQFEYLHNGADYKVIRKRTRSGKIELAYLSRNGTDWRLIASGKEAQAAINTNLMMDANLFLATAFRAQRGAILGQGDLARSSTGICEVTPAERKAVLYDILEDRLAQFDALHEACKATVKTLDEALAAARVTREQLQTLIAMRETTETAKTGAQEQLGLSRSKVAKEEERTSGLRESLAQHEAALNRLAVARTECRNLESEGADLERQRTEWQTILDGDQALLARAEQIRRDAETADRLEAELKEFAERREALRLAQSAHEKAEVERRVAQERYKRASDMSEGAERVPCLHTELGATCPLLLMAQARASHDELTILEEGCKKAEHAQRDAYAAWETADTGYDEKAHREAQAKYDTLVRARPELALLAGAEARAEGARTALREVAKRMEETGRQLTDRRQECSDLDLKTAGAEQLAESLRIAEQTLEVARGEVEQYTRELAVYDERLRQVAEAEGELRQVEQQVAGQEHSRVIYATLQEAFSRDGIPALIIDATVPALEEIANDILAGLSDGRLTLKLTTQRLKITGGIAETLDIIVADQRGERSYEDYSGGERLRVTLSMSIGLGLLLAQRTGAKIETLILDEACSPLDAQGEDALIDCVNRLAARFACILVITHREALQDRLPEQIIVTTDGRASSAVVVA